MKRHVYSLIALGVLAGPLALSFDDRVQFWTHWPAVALASFLSGILFLFWDALVVKRGDWKFNPTYTGTWRLLGLPLGEWLFFITVPYACLFVFEVVRAYFPSAVGVSPPAWVLYLGALGFVGVAFLFRSRGYTFLALISVALFVATLAVSHPELAGRSEFWIWLGLVFVAFALVDGLYTALPTIWYNPQTCTGLRLGTIPVEDFLYNLGYLGLTLCFYLTFDGLFTPVVPTP